MSRVTREYLRQHEAVRKARGKATEHGCATCDRQAREWAYIHGEDRDNIQSYQPMCIPCHRAYDGKWSDEERARVSESMKALWAKSPGRKAKLQSEEHRAKLRAAWVRRKARMQGGDALCP